MIDFYESLYEDDEPVEKILLLWYTLPKGVTTSPDTEGDL